MLICDRHERIQQSAEAITKICDHIKDLINEGKIDYIAYELDNIINECNDIDDDAGHALDAGQSMEARLAEYKTAIEDLGFRRL